MKVAQINNAGAKTYTFVFRGARDKNRTCAAVHDLLRNNSISVMKSAFNESEYVIQTMLDETDYLLEDSIFLSALLRNDRSTELDHKQSSHIINLLKTFKKRFEIIDSLALLNRTEGFSIIV